MASRNRMSISSDLFSRLAGRVEEIGVSVSNEPRWLLRHSVSDAEMMAKADCRKLNLSRQQKTLIIEFEREIFFAAVGFSDYKSTSYGLSEIEATPALFSLVFVELSLEPSATPSAIRNALQDQHKGMSTYLGHELAQITCLFPPVRYFSVDPFSSFSSSIERITGGLACQTSISSPILIDEKTSESLGALFEGASEYIPFHLVLRGVLSYSWSSFFLELYRCVEHLYPAPRLENLLSEITMQQSIADLAEKLERILSWRPREDESLMKVLLYCSKSPLDEIIECFDRNLVDDFAKTAEIAGGVIYQLRNSLVHFRRASENIQLSDEKWNIVIRAMIDIVSEAYGRIGPKLYTDLSIN